MAESTPKPMDSEAVDTLSVQLAPDNARVKSHLMDGVIVLLIEALIVLISLYMTGRISADSSAMIYLVALMAVALVLMVTTEIVGLMMMGATSGMRRHNVRWVNAETGEVSGSQALRKWLFQILLAVPSVGFLPLFIGLMTKDADGRTVFDRVSGTRSVIQDPDSTLLMQAIEEQSALQLVSEEEDPDAPGTVKFREFMLKVRSPESPRHAAPTSATPAASAAAPAEKSASQEVEAGQVEIGEPSNPDAPQVGESQWALSSPPAALDLNEIGQSLVRSRSHGEAPLPLSDVKELTDLERTMGVRPEGSVRLVFDDGTRYDLVGTLLIGRSPVAEGEFAEAAVLSVSDEARSVSKAHIVLRVRDGEVFVEDLHSTNGTKLSLSDGSTQRVQPGGEVKVPAGVMVIFGRRRLLVSG